MKGKREVPFCIDFGSGLVGEGSLFSNEVANIEYSFMLLSIAAQATLGFIKITRNRMVYMQEYGRWARLYYTTNQLWCICISDGFQVMEMEGTLPRHQLITTKAEAGYEIPHRATFPNIRRRQQGTRRGDRRRTFRRTSPRAGRIDVQRRSG